MSLTTREQIVETVNRLFIYTDEQDWSKLQKVFADKVDFDMSSLGGEVTAGKPADQICEDWKAGFTGLDAVNHLAGNYLVEIQNSQATVYAYATATHFKESASKGNTREFVGTYNLHLILLDGVWKINSFKYNLKYATGNMSFE